MSKRVKMLYVWLLIFSFAGFVCFGLLVFHYREENMELLSLKKEYDELIELISEHEELKVNYTAVLGEGNSLVDQKRELEDKINTLNQEIASLQASIEDVNKKIKAIS